MRDLVFLKLGGSLITDKAAVESIRSDVIVRIAREIKRAVDASPQMLLLIGHGSGSFGHVAAEKFATRLGARTAEEWQGFAEVSDAAARLNQVVRRALLEAGIPVLTIQPSASALCIEGELVQLAVYSISRALDKSLVPLVYGDVALDKVQGGTIISTEEIFAFLARAMKPDRILLAGETSGVYDARGHVIPVINRRNIDNFRETLKGSQGTDVTGGMASKVDAMLDLVALVPGLSVQIFSGQVEGNVERAIEGKPLESATQITSELPL